MIRVCSRSLQLNQPRGPRSNLGPRDCQWFFSGFDSLSSSSSPSMTVVPCQRLLLKSATFPAIRVRGVPLRDLLEDQVGCLLLLKVIPRCHD